MRSPERGSVLIIAVIAMLIMAVLGASFTLLARLETMIGFNHHEHVKAQALAEAGLERARDALRAAAAAGVNGFTTALTTPNLPFSGTALAGGTYAARVDNDCAPLVPAAIQDPNCGTNPILDGNQTAVVTAWAAVGSGRARVRAILAVDEVWRHVCSNASQDNPPGYCNEPANLSGTPAIRPADPNDPSGPRAYDDLPRPILGCSRIDPLLHRRESASCRRHSSPSASCTR